MLQIRRVVRVCRARIPAHLPAVPRYGSDGGFTRAPLETPLLLFSRSGNQCCGMNRDGSGKFKEPDDSLRAADPGLHVALRYNRSSPSSSAGPGCDELIPLPANGTSSSFLPRWHNRLRLQCPVDPAWFCPPSTWWRTLHRLAFFCWLLSANTLGFTRLPLLGQRF